MMHDTIVVREAIDCGGGIVNTWSREMPISQVEHIRFEAVCNADDYEDDGDMDVVEVEVTIVYPVMKCWGRGIGLKGAKRG